jgi:hypothetical protein
MQAWYAFSTALKIKRLSCPLNESRDDQELSTLQMELSQMSLIYLFFGGRLTPTCNTDDDEKLVISLLECATLW